jgi:hypothetical protein
MKIMQFIQGGYQSYGTKDIAGFNNEIAAFLVKEGYAKEIGEKEDDNDTPPPTGNFKFQTKKPPKLPHNICAICGKEFKTKQVLIKHLWAKHAIK